MLNCKFLVPVQSVQFAPLLMGTAQSGVVPCVLEWVRSRCLMSLLGSEFTFWVEWLSALVYVNPNIMTKRLNTGVLFLFPLEAQHLTKGIGGGNCCLKDICLEEGIVCNQNRSETNWTGAFHPQERRTWWNINSLRFGSLLVACQYINSLNPAPPLAGELKWTE